MTNMVDREQPDKAREPGSKKPYEAPAFRFERVFEVSALSCGKISSTQDTCTLNTKVS
jgi:hypothetical protein